MAQSRPCARQVGPQTTQQRCYERCDAHERRGHRPSRCPRRQCVLAATATRVPGASSRPTWQLPLPWPTERAFGLSPEISCRKSRGEPVKTSAFQGPPDTSDRSLSELHGTRLASQRDELFLERESLKDFRSRLGARATTTQTEPRLTNRVFIKIATLRKTRPQRPSRVQRAPINPSL